MTSITNLYRQRSIKVELLWLRASTLSARPAHVKNFLWYYLKAIRRWASCHDDRHLSENSLLISFFPERVHDWYHGGRHGSRESLRQLNDSARSEIQFTWSWDRSDNELFRGSTSAVPRSYWSMSNLLNGPSSPCVTEAKHFPWNLLFNNHRGKSKFLFDNFHANRIEICWGVGDVISSKPEHWDSLNWDSIHTYGDPTVCYFVWSSGRHLLALPENPPTSPSFLTRKSSTAKM